MPRGTRLLIHVEGQTEETFVNEILGPHLYHRGYSQVSARLMGNVRLRSNRGGVKSWQSPKRDIINHLREDQGCIVTTMIDYYGLPQSGSRAWPGRAEAGRAAYQEQAHIVERAIAQDIQSAMGAGFDPARFIPNVIMHEFEGLLFSDCVEFANGIGQPNLATPLQAIRNQFATPEEINDSPLTAPSKRIESLLPGYQKPLLGPLAIIQIGLQPIRAACPHFDAWIGKLES